jgi:hypothetical protein
LLAAARWLVHRELAAFKVIRWVLFRFLVLPKGYNTYVRHGLGSMEWGWVARHVLICED